MEDTFTLLSLHKQKIMATKRTCLIIGATTGIGKETAEHLAKKGWTVIVTGRNKDKGNKVGLRIDFDMNNSDDSFCRS